MSLHWFKTDLLSDSINAKNVYVKQTIVVALNGPSILLFFKVQ